MQRFYYFLSQNPNYPQMICANSKQQVKNLILQNLGQGHDDSIVQILTEQEFSKRNGQSGAIYKDANEFKSGTDFLTNVIKSACVESKPQQQIAQPIESQQIANINQPSSQKPKFFQAGGQQFKMQNGKIFKKVWKEVQDKESFRILNSTTSKPINSQKYIIQNLIWEQIE